MQGAMTLKQANPRMYLPMAATAIAGYYATNVSAIGAGAGTTGLKEGQSETFFFMPAGPQMVGQAAWDDIVARTIDAMATGKVRAVLDEECGEYVGVDGVYKAQERMRKGLNVGKIYASFPEKAGATGQQCEAKAGVAVEAKE